MPERKFHLRFQRGKVKGAAPEMLYNTLDQNHGEFAYFLGGCLQLSGSQTATRSQWTLLKDVYNNGNLSSLDQRSTWP